MNKRQKDIFKQYSSDSGRIFYRHVMGDGSDHIHYGIYETDQTPMLDALTGSSKRLLELCQQRRSVESMQSILDLGAGAGGATKYLLSWTDAAITCFDLGEPSLLDLKNWAKEKNLSQRVETQVGSFDEYPEEWGSKYDIVWSQDALCHAENRSKLFGDLKRSLKSEGILAFTDILLAETASEEQIKAFSSVNAVQSLENESQYTEKLKAAGFENITVEDWTPNLKTNFEKMLNQIVTGREMLLENNVPEELISGFAEALKKRISWSTSPMEWKAFICW